MTADDPTSRRRGAPAGNLNALKHGFYARTFKPDELTDLDRTDVARLTDEINALRVILSRTLQLSGDLTDPAQALNVLRATSLAATSLTRLVRTQQFTRRHLFDFRQLMRGIEAEYKTTLANLPSAEPEIEMDPPDEAAGAESN